jgi:D-3-phosphoglycerate dehydrogenase
LIDEQALLDALTQGHLAGAALDVLEHEPPLEGHPLFQLSNVIVTPHAAYHSAEALVELQRSAAQNIVRLFTGQELKNLVNPQVRNVQV